MLALLAPVQRYTETEIKQRLLPPPRRQERLGSAATNTETVDDFAAAGIERGRPANRAQPNLDDAGRRGAAPAAAATRSTAEEEARATCSRSHLGISLRRSSESGLVPFAEARSRFGTRNWRNCKRGLGKGSMKEMQKVHLRSWRRDYSVLNQNIV